MRVIDMEQGNQSKETRGRAGGKRSRRKGENVARIDKGRKKQCILTKLIRLFKQDNIKIKKIKKKIKKK